MKLKNVSTPLVATAVWTPLSASLRIDVSGGTTQQWYHPSEHRWEPSYDTTTPMTLSPVLSAYDGDTGTTYERVSSQYVYWYVVEGGVEKEVSTTTYARVLKVSSSGSLIVTSNLPMNRTLTLRCRMQWADPRNGDLRTDERDVMLSCMGVGESPYSLRLLRERVVRWNPLSGSSPVVSIKALSRKGADVADDDVVFFWYKKMSDGREVLIDDDAALCAAYMDGQRSPTLRVNADYAMLLTVVCRIGVIPDGGSASAVTAPDQPVRAQVTVMWNVPRIELTPMSEHGSLVREDSEDKHIVALMKQNGMDLDASVAQERLVLDWKLKPSTVDSVTSLGCGPDITIEASELRKRSATDADSRVPRHVWAEVGVKEALLPLVDSNGKYIVDKALASGGKIVVGRVY